MSEQITLFDEVLTSDTFGDKLNEILEAAREKSGYYKFHESGRFEMMKDAPASELYDILELRESRSGDIGFYFDCQLYIKFSIKNEALNITKELYTNFLPDLPSEDLKGNQAPKGGVQVSLPLAQQKDFFEKALGYLIKVKKPTNSFGCCSRYIKCSEAGKCLHEHPYYSKGCAYRANLENGENYYKRKDKV